MRVRVVRARHFKGRTSAPGDKSISHRALILAALSNGTCQIANLAPGEDVRSTASCLVRLGVSIEMKAGSATVQGTRGSLRPPTEVLDCGNSGTTMRLLSGVVAGGQVDAMMDGDSSLRRRPMSRILEPLRQMGAQALGRPGPTGGETAPLQFRRSLGLVAKAHQLPIASAQVKGCLLLAGMSAEGETIVREPAQSRDHTERMLKAFGAPLQISEDGAISIRRPDHPLVVPGRLDVPGDPSSAAFLVAAALLVPGSEVTVDGVDVNPTRSGFFDALRRMGAPLGIEFEGAQAGEPTARIVARSASELRATEIEPKEIPALIDEVPILSVLATQASGTTVIRGAGELRFKESDRLAQIATGLKAMGADVRELADGLEISGPSNLAGATIDSQGDHRIAMSFAVAGLIAEGETRIENAQWADISFPGFFELIGRFSEGAVW